MELAIKYDNLRFRILRGASILQILNDFKLVVEPGSNLLKIGDDFRDGSNNEKVDRFLLELQAAKNASRKIVHFFEEYFNMNSMSEEQFRKKHFKGYRILQTIHYLDFIIKECELNIGVFKDTFTDVQSDLVAYYRAQIIVYKEFRGKLDKIFVQKDYNVDRDARIEEDFPSLDMWLKSILDNIKK